MVTDENFVEVELSQEKRTTEIANSKRNLIKNIFSKVNKTIYGIVIPLQTIFRE